MVTGLASKLNSIAQAGLSPWTRRLPHLLAIVGAGAIAVSVPSILQSIGGQKSISGKQGIVIFLGFVLVLWSLVLASPIGRPTYRKPSQWPSLNIWIFALAGVNAVTIVAYSVLSYGMAPSIQGPDSIGADAFFSRLSQQLSPLGREAQAFTSGQSLLAQPPVLLLVYSSLLLVLTVTFLTLIVLLALYREELDTNSPKLLFSCAVIFAGIMMIAEPVLAPDFWTYIAWGRMVATGLNPYYVFMTPEVLQGLPLDVHDLRLTYGPLWAIISAVTELASRNVFVEAAIFKLLITGAWIGSLRLIWLLLARHSLWHQCAGIALFGWLPVSVAQAMGEGHNDSLMILPMLYWLYGLERDTNYRASLSLAASALVKYATAPLFLLDLAWSYRSRRRLRQYLPQMILVAVSMLLAYGVFYESPDLFSGLVSIGSLHFFTPGDAIVTAGQLIGIRLGFSNEVVRAFFLILATYFVIHYLKKPDHETFRRAVLAALSAMLFGVLGYVWPWYVLWIVAVGALVPDSGLSRWALGVGLGAPFLLLLMVFFPYIDLFLRWSIPGLAVYTFAILWSVLAPRHWFPSLIQNSSFSRETETPSIS